MPLALDDILAQPVTKGGFNATSGAASLANPTTAGNTLLIAACTYGASGVSTPSGYTPDQPTNVATAKVYWFHKSNIAAGEALPTLSTGASTQKTVWFALEVSGLDLVAPKDVASPIATATAQSISTATVIGTSYDAIGFCLHLAQNAASTTPPTWSGLPGSWAEVAEQGQADATTSIGAALGVYAPLQSLTLPAASAASSLAANGPLAAVTVTYMAAGSKTSADIRLLLGFEHGSNAGLTTGVSGNRYLESKTGTATITNVTPRSGSWCLEVSATAGISNVTASFAGSFRVSAFVPFRLVGSLPAADTELFTLETTYNCVVRYIAATGKIGVKLGAGTEQVSAEAVTADTWHTIDLDYAMEGGTATTQAASWRLNGADEPQATLVATGATGSSVLRLGWTAAATATVRYDDVVVAGRKGNWPLGDHKVVLVGVDPAGTLSVNGSAANFNTFSANGTMAAWNAATARDAIGELPPTIGASADGIAQVTAATADYVKIPMATYTAAANETVRAVRMLACGWAAASQAKTLAFYGNHGADTLPAANQQLIALGDPLFTNSTTDPAWACKVFTPQDGAGWAQARLDALEFRVGGSDDATPDVGIHAIYAEVAVAAGQAQPLFGTSGDVEVSAEVDPLSGGILALEVTTPPERGVSVTYEVNNTPTSFSVAAGSSHTEAIGAPDHPTVNLVTMTPDPEPDDVYRYS
jgi:hypothetical protein